MSLTAAIVTAQFQAARSVLSGASVGVRHEGREYTGLRGSTEFSNKPGAMGAVEGADGAVRLCVSEMQRPYPDAGDAIEVQEQIGGEWQERRVILARFDQTGATVRIDYGERHG